MGAFVLAALASDARMPHIETKIGISYGFQMFSIVSSLEIFMWIQLCDYIIIMQLQSYVHSHKQYIIHCMQRHFVAVSSCNSGVWIKSGLWGQSSLAGLAHSDEVVEAWRAGTDAAVMLFIERSGDVFWYLFFPLLCCFYITISQMKGELPRGKVLNTGTCKRVQ